jgi:ABC-2 type transport system ATP-binding protein
MLIIKELSKSFGEKQVLESVSFKIPKGKVCALLGLNGAGKSTLMKIICNLVFADSGFVEFDGRKIIGNKTANIGYMIETPRFYRELSGKQNLVALSFLYEDIPSNRVDEVLSLVGLASQKNIAVKKYSLGMEQRLYFAYAILNNPKIIILDEPFNGIDPVSVNLFQKLIRELAQKGCAVLVSGHTINDIQNISDCVVILDHGKLIYKDENSHGKDLTKLFLSLVGFGGEAQ